jgi:3'-phosphoadenosine 5'-phosphosulfate sulfotransferase (PAPS reductase)/FAD synthetase
MTTTTTDAQVDRLIARGALFVHNHSGGKDSQASYLKLRARVPAAQIVVVHAVLDEVTWEGSEAHIRATIGDDVELILAQPASTFFEMVDRRGMFPSPANRQCTSDLKRTPIDREIRRYLAAHPEFGGLVVSVQGMRAEESSGRAKLAPLKVNSRGSIAGREWYDWLPIHDMLEAEVFAAIAQAGQEPFWTYAAGMSRMSCAFCIMSCQADLTIAATLRPELYARYVAKERELGFTLSMSRRTLPEITGIAA